MPPVIVASAFGGPEVLTVVDQPTGRPGPDEVLIDVRAAGINPIDWKLYSGARGADESTLPRRVGFEVSGVVAAAGRAATGPSGPIAEGDAVIAFRIEGGYAAQVVVAAKNVLPKPDALSFEQAGGLMLAGTTAVHMLEATGVGDGDTVLVHAASGGVGRLLVQLAKLRGARVIGTASAGNHDDLRGLGVEPLTYEEGLVDRVRALAPDGVDVALDCVGTDEAVDASLELVADRDRIATIVGFHRDDVGIKRLGGGPGADPGTELRDAARLSLLEIIERGKLDVVAEGFPLADVAGVHRRAMKGHANRKLVLVP